MKNVLVTPAAQKQIDALAGSAKLRILTAVLELRNFPAVSNIRALTGQWKGWYRKRVGDYRIRFYLRPPDDLIIDKIGKRGDFYE